MVDSKISGEPTIITLPESWWLIAAETDTSNGKISIADIYRKANTTTNINFDANHTVPANAQIISNINFLDDSSTAVERTYAQIRSLIETPTNLAEDGELFISVIKGGTLTDYIKINEANDGFVSLGATLDLNSNNLVNFGYIESNAATPSTTGIVRLGNTEKISWRNSIDASDVSIWASGIGGFNSDAGWDFNTNDIRGITFAILGAGSTPANGGTILMANTNQVNWRNFGNTADLGFQFNASDLFVFNSTIEKFGANIISNHAAVTPVGADSILILDATDGTIKSALISNLPSGGSQTPWTSNIDAATFALLDLGYVEIGTNPAVSGAVRMGNNLKITVRNAANTADIDIFYLSAADDTVFHAGTGELMDFRIGGGSVFSASASGIVLAGNRIIDVGYLESFATSPADAGAIRLGNTEYINWRQFGGAANAGIGLTASDELAFTWFITTHYTFGTTQADFKGNNLVTVGTLNTHTIPGGTGTLALTSQLFANPQTTKGDLLGFSTVPARVQVGANGTVLIAESASGLGVKYDNIYDDNVGFHTSTKITITDKTQLNSALAYTDQANTFGAGFKQTFGADTLIAPINIGDAGVADPATTVNGDFWFRNTASKLFYKAGNITRTLNADSTINFMTADNFFVNQKLRLGLGGANPVYIFDFAAPAASRNITIPTLLASDTFVFANHIQSISNKTLLSFIDIDTSIQQSGGILQYDVASTFTHDFRVNNAVIASLSSTVLNLASGVKFQENSVNISPIGLHDIYIDAGGVLPVDAGALATRIVGTGIDQKAFAYVPFINGAVSFATVKIVLPRTYNLGTVTAVIEWTSAVEGAGTVEWDISGCAIGDGEDMSTVVYGTAVTSTDTQTTINQVQTSPRTTAITLGNTPADGNVIFLKIQRDGVTDTFTQPAQLLGVWIEITTDSAVSV